ncbi:MAG: tRNA (adenosine(37)-N6)-threonylcarbamoyltransferase complex dimerization subunit type 1 TsaB [Phenylobacterium sp.]|uniref:tRNA (adenosine(37)-N6)-threonylcarbamoyltransferase complex dimerization subunit type 1 TsaB n=1 Tax=Phenylobacterium sp. TaxID=1871053 RepID=UPI00272180B2|nr:tRNA (adenosine(37)-N6)-threonylcarbamoyltransferase complex dimerization subunit type 1 TsaB [Phenylobacterium sp.]MDO9431790.1 tRNA (adenosine(37)-N6)-threonylcarbamoyltransferase complex dimerization subunit type 1 TsaB [Phenylobacterium sp.]
MVLAIDTCLFACSVAVVDGERVLARRVEPMSRGHQERLAPLVQEAMVEAGLGFDRLDRIGVTVGPGSFTGLRVGLAFAKGLAAALAIPAVGIGSLEALAEPERGNVVAVLDAKRGQVYLQAFSDGVPVSAPDALPIETAAARLAEFAPDTLIGTGAALLADVRPGVRVVPADVTDPVAVARLAAGRSPVPPRPLYLRAPDAKLPGGKTLEA